MPLFLRLTVDTKVTWEQGLSNISKSKKSTSIFYISRRRTARLYILTVAISMSCFKSLLPKYLYDIELGQDHEDLQGCEEVPEGGQRDSVNCNSTLVNCNNQELSVI